MSAMFKAARPSRHFSMGSWSRNIEGVIATYENGDVRHFHQSGYMQAVADYADTHGTTVVSLSTPETIYRDLQGTRAHIEPRHNTKQPPESFTVPEAAMLGRIGRRDILRGWEARPKHG